MNIIEPILYQAKLNPATTAICTPGANIEKLNYTQLARAIHSVSRAALAHGLAPGNTVGLHVRETILHAIIILALTRLGICTVSTRRGATPPELGIDAVITDLPQYTMDGVRVIRAELAWAGGDGSPLDFDEIHRSRPDDPARIVLTSGTTGTPKAVAFTHRMIAERNACYTHSKGSLFAQTSRIFCTLSVSTNPGFRHLVHLLSIGGTVYYEGGDPVHMLQAIGLFGIQGMSASPHGLGEYCKFYESHAAFECGVDFIICQGALLAKELSQRVRQRMCSNLFSSYGATETGTAAFGPANVLSTIPGAVGFVQPNFTVEIVDETGRKLPAGTEGRVRTRSDYMATRYVGDPASTAAAFRDGYFYPGDLGYVTPDGILVISGREKTALNLGGDIVKPDTIEDVLIAHADIGEAAVFEMKNELGVAELWSLIVPRAAFDEASLRAHCGSKLPEWCIPVRFVVTDAIPRGEQGKIARHALAEAAKARLRSSN